MVPVSVRVADARGALGNQVAAMMVPLPADTDDPLTRLEFVMSATHGLKRGGQAVGAHVLTDLTGFAPATLMGQAARLAARQRFFNVVVTSVPGPPSPLLLAGPGRWRAAVGSVPDMKERVISAARDLGLDVAVRTLDAPTRTVSEAAAAVGCEPAQIAKTIVFVADGEPVLVVASGSHRVDPDKLPEAFDCAEIRQASADEVRAATGYPVGGVSPICPGLPVLFDEPLLPHARIWPA